MSLIKTSLLLLSLALLAITVYSHDDHLPYKCTHDSEDRPEPELMDVEEDFTEGEEHEGRTLASYHSLRTYGYYGRLSSTTTSYRAYLENDLFPPILDYLSAALKVKYPVTGSLKVSSNSVCSGSTPSILKNGVNADFVLFVEADYDTSRNWVASTTTCTLASGSKRPLTASTTVNRNLLKSTSNILLHEKNILCMLHEVVHALGFSSSLYKHFVGSNGQRLNGHLTTSSYDGGSSKVLNVSPLTNRLRNHFGCSNLKGAYMENSGSSGTAGSHFERRMFGHEMMTSGLIYQMEVSQFTLALLEGSGWYVADYDFADPYGWGQGEGCGFLLNNCQSSSFNHEGFCKGSSRGCSSAGRGGGSCKDDSRSDGCKFIHPNVDYDCENPEADNYARLPSLQTFGRGKGSKCFSGTLSSSSGASTTTFCFKHTCNGSQLTLHVGNQSVVCTRKGTVSVNGYKGTINCPDPVQYCKTTGRKACPRNCMGRGNCNNGVCNCSSGYKGADCALRSGF